MGCQPKEGEVEDEVVEVEKENVPEKTTQEKTGDLRAIE